jgi:hypothetical protein
MTEPPFKTGSFQWFLIFLSCTIFSAMSRRSREPKEFGNEEKKRQGKVNYRGIPPELLVWQELTFLRLCRTLHVNV